MAEREELKPGSLVELSCPPSQRPQLEKGQFLPSSENSSFVVAEISGEKVFLGPLKAGDLDLEFSCSDGSSIQKLYTLKAVAKEELPKHSPPLAPLSLSYPLWFWAGLALMCGAIFWALRLLYLRLTKKFVKKPVTATPQKSDSELFREFIKQSSKRLNSNAPQLADAKVTRDFYSTAYVRLRSFLEENLRLSVFHESSKEFVGTLKAAAARAQLSPALIQSIESSLAQADQVKFAHLNPPLEEQKYFLKQLETIFETLRRNSG